MTILTTNKQQLIAEYAHQAGDTGSCAVQIALLTQRILLLTQHCKIHKKDCSTRRGLQILVAKRRSLLQYVERKNKKEHGSLLQRLGIRG
ncbi:MAG TPA: 30S ribosomal protein S15 [Patescibacteria group bacterium]|jgi:small subunit ribosomal protein S15|nr:30S ribosomal protein S15 [Patescibacteria group bacterium]